MKNIKKLLFISSLFMVSNTLYAVDYEKDFNELNDAIYLIETKRDVCNQMIPAQANRNSKAFNEWEDKYAYFLDSLDSIYIKWKNIFNEPVQQQFAIKESNGRLLAAQKIRKDLKDGAEEKCFNYHPALKRPRSDVGAAHEQALETVRYNSNNDFIGQDKSGLERDQCTWEQTTAKKSAERRDQGITEKAQEAGLKAMKKAKSTLSKKEKKKQVAKMASIIGEVYEYRTVTPLAYSQYRFSLCDKQRKGLQAQPIKKVLKKLVKCQSRYPNGWDNGLGVCINSATSK